MKCKKYVRQHGRMVEYRISQGLVTMPFIVAADYQRDKTACCLKAVRAEIRKQVARLI